MNHSDLDRTIDLVARDMTAADVPAGFRGHVLAAIDERPRRNVLASRPLVWAGAAVVVIALGLVTRQAWQAGESQPPATLSVANTPGTAPATAPVVAPSAVADTAREQPATDTTSPTHRRRNTARLAPQRRGLAWEAGPAPLPAPDPITIDALAPAALDIPGVAIAPMDEIQPITIPPAGPGLTDPQRRDKE